MIVTSWRELQVTKRVTQQAARKVSFFPTARDTSKRHGIDRGPGAGPKSRKMAAGREWQ